MFFLLLMLLLICEAASPNRIFENVDDLASKCNKNYGAAAKIGKVMKDCVQKGEESKNGENSY